MGCPSGADGEPPLERNACLFDCLEQPLIELAEGEVGLSAGGVG